MSQLTFSVGDEDAIRERDALARRAENVRNSVHLKETASRQMFLLGVAAVVVVMFALGWMAA